MNKTLIFAFSLGWLLTANLSCSALKVSKAQNSPSARNAQGDLYGENLGDQIVLDWDLHDGATGYLLYRSTSLAGPWEQRGSIRESAARTGGARVDVTPDARLMDLCYKVEAINPVGHVIRVYQPICVPKFDQ